MTTGPAACNRLVGVLMALALTLAVTLAGCGSNDTPSSGGATTSFPSVPLPAPGANCLRPADHADVVRFGPSQSLAGYVLGRGSSYVVLAHQSDGDSCQMLPLARRLAAARFHVLAFDFPGVGGSPYSPHPHPRSDDVVAAVQFVRSEHARSVALVGASLGGYATLGAVTERELPAGAVDAVIGLSAPRTYPDGGRRVDVSHLSTPLQLFVGHDDIQFVTASRELARQDPQADLHVIDTVNHGVDLVDRRVFAMISRFLREHAA